VILRPYKEVITHQREKLLNRKSGICLSSVCSRALLLLPHSRAERGAVPVSAEFFSTALTC